MKVSFLSFCITQEEYDKFILNTEIKRDPAIIGDHLSVIHDLEQDILNARKQERYAPFVRLLEGLFNLIELDLMDDMEPDYSLPMPSKEEVNKLYQDIDDYFEDELKKHWNYWGDRGIDELPDFARLNGKAKLYGFQQWQKLKEGLKPAAVWLWYEK